jgi:hypothetical protein
MDKKIPLGQSKLENLCLLYLRQFPRCQGVLAITLERPVGGSANWVVRDIQPPLSIVAGHQARLALQDLHDMFRMVT